MCITNRPYKARGRGMSQKSAILSHLKSKKTITPLQALELFGCFRLAARISELRESGHLIETETVHQGDKHYAKYRLVA